MYFFKEQRGAKLYLPLFKWYFRTTWGKTLFTAVQMVLKNNVGKTLFTAVLKNNVGQNFTYTLFKWYI